MNRTKLRTAAGIAVITTLMMPGAPVASAAGADRVPGEQRRWALQFRTRLEQPGAGRPMEISLSGEWASTVSAVRSGEYDVALELSGARLKGDGIPSNSPHAIQQVEQRLARTFWATYRDDGALLAVHFFKDVDPSDRNLLQMVASEAQLVRPNSGEMVWTVLERDGAGSYLAIYNRDERQGVVKRKLKYVHADGEVGVPPGGFQVDVDYSDVRFVLEPDGGVAALDASSRVRIGVPLSDQAPLVAVTETHLANLSRTRAPELIGSLAHAGADVVSSPIVTHKSDPEKLRARQDGHLLAGHTTKSLLDAAMVKSDEDQWLAERLLALFRQRPEATLAAVELLRQSGPHERITNALASANSPVTIEALCSLARDSSVPIGVRVDAVAALARVRHPNTETMRIAAAFLADDHVQLQSAAQLTSGALARAGRAENRAEADSIDSALIARYRTTQEVRGLRNLLAALGNSVGPSVLPVIAEALHDSRVSVRAAAARALRLAEEPEVDGLLSAAITADSDPQVRLAAIFAASFRRSISPLGEALVQAAREDPVVYVRSSAVTLLRQHPEASPNITATMAWVAEHDSKASVRRLAREALASVSRRN